MNGNIYNLVKRWKILVTLFASTLTFFLLLGTAAAEVSWGILDRDRDLDNRFRSYEAMQEYNYYTTGGYDRPTAILLIDKKYELDNPGNLTAWSISRMRRWVS